MRKLSRSELLKRLTEAKRGRTPRKADAVTRSVVFTPQQIAALEAMASEFNCSFSAAVRMRICPVAIYTKLKRKRVAEKAA